MTNEWKLWLNETEGISRRSRDNRQRRWMVVFLMMISSSSWWYLVNLYKDWQNTLWTASLHRWMICSWSHLVISGGSRILMNIDDMMCHVAWSSHWKKTRANSWCSWTFILHKYGSSGAWPIFLWMAETDDPDGSRNNCIGQNRLGWWYG